MYVFGGRGHTPILPTLVPIKANILIDQTGRALLADFGLLTIISDPTNGLSSSSSMQGGSVRWMSPELLDPQRFGLEKSRPTTSSDCYALGMVVYETISGHLPFCQHTDYTVVSKVLDGKHPPREARFTDSLWRMLRLCWEPQPNTRPKIEDVLQCLGMEPPLLRLDVETVGGDNCDSESDSSGKFTRLISSGTFQSHCADGYRHVNVH